MKFHCFGNWHLIEVITREDLIIVKDTIREINVIFVTNFIHDKNPLYGSTTKPEPIAFEEEEICGRKVF